MVARTILHYFRSNSSCRRRKLFSAHQIYRSPIMIRNGDVIRNDMTGGCEAMSSTEKRLLRPPDLGILRVREQLRWLFNIRMLDRLRSAMFVIGRSLPPRGQYIRTEAAMLVAADRRVVGSFACSLVRSNGQSNGRWDTVRCSTTPAPRELWPTQLGVIK